MNKFFSKQRNANLGSGVSTAVPSAAHSMDGSPGTPVNQEKGHSGNTGKAPHVTVRTIVMTLLVAMGGFIFGYDTGQISGFLEMRVFLEMFGQPTAVTAGHPFGYYFTNVRSGLIVALLSIGTLIGCLIAGPLANKFGRRTCIPPWCLVFCVGVVIQMAVGDGQWVGIVMGRWVAGLGVGALSVLIPLYMAETSPVPVRGAVISCYQLFITIGIFTADCINYGTEARNDTGSYRIPMGVGFIWAIMLGVGILFLPESPRHDWNRGFSDRARTTMSKFYGLEETHPLIVNETKEIQDIMEATQGDHPWYEAFTGPRMFYRVALAMTLQMLQQLTGANYFFYYGTTIFAGVGIKNSYVTAMILGGVNVGSTFLGVYMARHFRRRESLYIAAFWQFICFMIFASVGQFLFKNAPEGSSTAKTAGTVMIVFACFFIVGFATTWGPLVWACISEMFPYRYRAVAMGCATSANWFWNFMLAFFTPFITGDIQFAYGYVFAGCNLAAFIVVYFFLLESSGHSLEEVDAMYLMHVPPRKSGKYMFDEETKRNLSATRRPPVRTKRGNLGKKKRERGDIQHCLRLLRRF
ncbi:MFS sugar transporter-like protein [Amylocarpus encephaloides]|uniref:MFS sugar transporter-like protein n=1 Tax=Amylocarpus encephaloides TaxID=45428 RepID=A0A9P7YS86_9HELO|nr:MFS sugar transporter-like protein [Amylocarpus encephaloides]